MKTLLEQYQDLDRAVNDRYRELINQVKEVVLYEPETEDFEENIYDCEIVTYISKGGDNVDVKVLKIAAVGGIFVVEDEDDRKRYWIGLNDLADLGDKIQIVTLLEKHIA